MRRVLGSGKIVRGHEELGKRFGGRRSRRSEFESGVEGFKVVIGVVTGLKSDPEEAGGLVEGMSDRVSGLDMEVDRDLPGGLVRGMEDASPGEAGLDLLEHAI